MSIETSDLYVWVWLPGEVEPVPAGVLTHTANGLAFGYGKRYLERENAVSLAPTLPLQADFFATTGNMGLPSAIRDSSPDAWGRRVILNQLTSRRGPHADTADLSERVYLLNSNSDRIGALDFQGSPRKYEARGNHSYEGFASLPSLQEVAELVAAGKAVPQALHDAVLSGTGIGGARPKALVELDGVPSMIKFSMSTDVFPVVQAEAIASRLAIKAGVRTPRVEATTIDGRYALISERFDRDGTGKRRMIVSALTFVERTEESARDGGYPELVERARALSADAASVGPEVFQRIAFNMAISNGDDHLRNHAGFWDGTSLELTPAYDLAPQARREGAEVFQTLKYDASQKVANFAELMKSSHLYNMTQKEGREVIENIRNTIETGLDEAAEEMLIPEATLSAVRSSFLHPTVVRGSGTLG